MRVCGGITNPQKGWEGVGSEVAGQSPTPSSRWERAIDQPFGSPGDLSALLGGCGSLISAGFHPAVFSVPDSGALFSP